MSVYHTGRWDSYSYLECIFKTEDHRTLFIGSILQYMPEVRRTVLLKQKKKPKTTAATTTKQQQIKKPHNICHSRAERRKTRITLFQPFCLYPCKDNFLNTGYCIIFPAKYLPYLYRIYGVQVMNFLLVNFGSKAIFPELCASPTLL